MARLIAKHDVAIPAIARSKSRSVCKLLGIVIEKQLSKTRTPTAQPLHVLASLHLVCAGCQAALQAIRWPFAACHERHLIDPGKIPNPRVNTSCGVVHA